MRLGDNVNWLYFLILGDGLSISQKLNKRGLFTVTKVLFVNVLFDGLKKLVQSYCSIWWPGQLNVFVCL